MKKAIIVRYCEIHLKGKNRRFFQNLLIENIKNSLKNFKYKLEILNARYLIEEFNDSDFEPICSKLQKVCGVHSYSPAYVVNSNYREITECAQLISKDKSGDFKVETNRADKTFPLKSVELSREVGGNILESNPALKVNVIDPKTVIRIDIREGGETLIFSDTIKCLSGMPVGSGGKGVIMISGGIDSPVAAFMMAKRGMQLEAVHFFSYPYTSELAKQKVIDLTKIVSEYHGSINLHLVKFTAIQEEIHKKCPEQLMITMMRRFMMRITERIANKVQGQAIITGESLGQVASQTIESITSSNSVVTLPVLRPLIAFDKLDIIEISKKIGTYETSILPYEDCCTVFLPKFPAIKPRLETVLKYESNLDVEKLIADALSETEVIKL
ncbi:MAG: tRNA uracil 4-sulfurtransferase ThiI [Christensenellaceae bacterium]